MEHDEQNKTVHFKEETPPTTLEEARKNLEYALLKEYLSTKEKEEIETFLNTRITLEQSVKERLEEVFLKSD